MTQTESKSKVLCKSMLIVTCVSAKLVKMGQVFSYFYAETTFIGIALVCVWVLTQNITIPSRNPEDPVINSELKPSQNGFIDQHGLSDPEGIEPERRDGDSCETNVGPSCVSRRFFFRSPETGSETERGTSPDRMSPTTTVGTEHLEGAERINIWVKCSGKSEEVNVFPLERVSVLLEDSCQKLGKNPKKMMLIYNGEKMDKEKTVQEYSLRGGMTVHLIPSA
ncbi:uncharacterized protein LOC118231177 isoform X2 [Anguilla anguilla]|uniref:uncharacterized protein LOC118231177 isoform X2 n=1 Tax=Anguilla anguilla TaxID=7936 RepID=UPI0015ADAE34|nr:uncharacterized protein LOC118231177 isoform X2 [Anguilla anguilla]